MNLPPLVENWPHEIIVLVWKALPEILSSPLLKDSFNVRKWTFLEEQKDSPYRVVIFDCYPDNLSASIRNLFGGYPVLVYDVSRLSNRHALNTLDRKRVYSFNLPYFLPFALQSNPHNMSHFLPLIHKSKRTPEDKRNDSLIKLHHQTNHLDWNVICCGCFGNMNGLGQFYHDGLDGTAHNMCEDCMFFAETAICFHYSHEYLI